MGIFDGRFMNNLEKVSNAGFKVVYGESENSRNVQSIYKGYKTNIDRLQRQLYVFQRNIDIKERRLESLDRRIENAEMYIERLNSRGLMNQFSRRYKDEKGYIKYLKKQKKIASKQIKSEYKRIKLENKRIKQAKKELRKFEKYVNRFAKEHKYEIKFITYYKKNENKLKKVYNKEQITEIKNYIKRIREGKEGYKDITVQECLNQLKEATSLKYNKLGMKKRKIDKSKTAVFGFENQKDNKEEIQVGKKSKDNKKSNNFKDDLKGNTVFSHSNINREVLEYGFKKVGSKRTPEQLVFAIGLAEKMDAKTYKTIMMGIKEGQIPNSVREKSKNYYMKRGIDLIEKMITNDKKENLTNAEKMAKKVADVYTIYYEEWNKLNENQQSRYNQEREAI